MTDYARICGRHRLADLCPDDLASLGLTPVGFIEDDPGKRRLRLDGPSVVGSLDELPDIARWDPTPEEQAGLRERLLRAGEARAGPPATS